MKKIGLARQEQAKRSLLESCTLCSTSKRIVIIGSPGAGKTRLARELHSLLHINVFHLDRLFWQRGWKGKSFDARLDILQRTLLKRQYIIEGSYYISPESYLSATSFLAEADAIIFLDLNPFLCLWGVITRHFLPDIPEDFTNWFILCLILMQRIFISCLCYRMKRHFSDDRSLRRDSLEGYAASRRDIPGESTDRFTLHLIRRVLVFPFGKRKEFERDLQHCDSKRIIRFYSRKAVNTFLAQLVMQHTRIANTPDLVGT